MSRSPLDEIQASLRGRLADLDDLERAFLTLRPQLDGRAGAAAIDVAVDRIGTVRQAVDQALEEIEVEDGLYLTTPGPSTDPALAPRIVEPHEAVGQGLRWAFYADHGGGRFEGPFVIRELAERALKYPRRA